MRTIAAAAFALGLLGCATADKGAMVPGSPLADRDAEAWAQSTLGRLSPEEKVGQLFMIWVRSEFMGAESPTYLELRDRLRRFHVGGLAMSVPVRGPVLVKSRPEEAALLLNRLQRESKWPLLVAADFEVGVAARLDGATAFPQAMAFGSAGRPDHARAFGRITAREARAIGVHWNFVPVADVNSNPANPIINTRSFGEDPQQVGELVAAYVEGAHEGGMLTAAKHFPGHGDTATDSHYGVAQVTGDLDRLESVELPPFRRAIEAGVDAVMVAHVTVPAIEPSPDKVATTSSAIVTDLLKKRLGFDGVVVTDALDMAALTKKYAADVGRAAVDAFKAGNDYLIIPADLPASWRAMLAAVKSGEVSSARLDEAVLKILRWKAALGLHRARLVDVSRVPSLVGRPEDAAVAQQIADDAVALVRDEARVLPLEAAPATVGGLPYLTSVQTRNRLVVVVLSRDVSGPWGHVFGREVRRRVPDANVILVDRRTAGGATDDVLRAAQEAEVVVVAAFVAPEPGEAEADAGPGDPTGRLLEALLDRAADKTVVVAAGSPYVAQAFPEIRSYLCTFSSAAVSERSAVRALFGEFPTRGRLPVTIPGVAERGDGITLRPPGEAVPRRRRLD
jgi:beta-N-acetylhexosaminidase